MHPGLHLATQAGKPAIVMGGSGFVQTFAELDAAANRFSRVLRAAGVRPGDHVAICMENHDRFFEVVWGCHYAGAVYTTCSSRLTSAELAYIVDDCGATVFVTSLFKAQQAGEIVAATPKVSMRLMLDGTVPGYDSYEAAVAAQQATPLPEPRIAGADMLYSSGTTGLPKGVEKPFAAGPIDTTPAGVEMVQEMLFGVSERDVYLTPAPCYHAAPLRFSLAAVALGATVVVMEHFDPEQFLAVIERHGVTITQVVPTMFVRLLRLPPEVRAAYDLSSLTRVVHAAAPCPVSVKRAVIDWLGPIVHEYYAGTESNGLVYCDSEAWLAHPGTVGRALTCTVHICDDDGAEVPTGVAGTVWFEGGNAFRYHNDPDKTRTAHHPQGWSTLGDVGYLDDEGFLYLTDRKAYMIITGGVNVYPQEAENALITHPQVVDVAVFGVPDDDYGEQVKAVVQPLTMPGSDHERRRLEKELIAHCRAQLADVKCPRSVDFRAELPRQPTGKLYKRQLQLEEYERRGLTPPWQRV